MRSMRDRHLPPTWTSWTIALWCSQAALRNGRYRLRQECYVMFSHIADRWPRETPKDSERKKTEKHRALNFMQEDCYPSLISARSCGGVPGKDKCSVQLSVQWQ